MLSQPKRKQYGLYLSHLMPPSAEAMLAGPRKFHSAVGEPQSSGRKLLSTFVGIPFLHLGLKITEI